MTLLGVSCNDRGVALARKPFVVLDAEILSSSVWSEAAHVRLVWITLLILCDTEGYIGAAIPGIATAAGVSIEQAQDALERLQNPDPWSRTKSNEGRRLALVDRGWRVLNFREHIDRLSSERAKARERMARFRSRQRNGNARNVTDPDSNVTVTLGNREQGIGNSEKRTEQTSAPTVAWSKEACDDWIFRFGGTAPGGRIGKALKPLVKKHTWEHVRPAWVNYLGEIESRFVSPEKFASTYGQWVVKTPKPELAEEKRKLDTAEDWLSERGTLKEMADAYLQWERENGSNDETEATMRRRWAREIGAPEEIGALLSQDIYRARKQ